MAMMQGKFFWNPLLIGVRGWLLYSRPYSGLLAILYSAKELLLGPFGVAAVCGVLAYN
jgi:hypothetical protein